MAAQTPQTTYTRCAHCKELWENKNQTQHKNCPDCRKFMARRRQIQLLQIETLLCDITDAFDYLSCKEKEILGKRMIGKKILKAIKFLQG